MMSPYRSDVHYAIARYGRAHRGQSPHRPDHAGSCSPLRHLRFKLFNRRGTAIQIALVAGAAVALQRAALGRGNGLEGGLQFLARELQGRHVVGRQMVEPGRVLEHGGVATLLHVGQDLALQLLDVRDGLRGDMLAGGDAGFAEATQALDKEWRSRQCIGAINQIVEKLVIRQGSLLGVRLGLA